MSINQVNSLRCPLCFAVLIVLDEGETSVYKCLNEHRFTSDELLKQLNKSGWISKPVTSARIQQAVIESEKSLQSFANLVPDLLWQSRPDGSTIWYNQRWLDYTGQSFEEAIGWGWVDAIHPEDRQNSLERYKAAVQASKTLRQEYRIRRHDGEYQWFLVSAAPVKDGQVFVMYGAATDIQNHRQSEKLLRNQEQRLHLALEATNLAVYEWDLITDQLITNVRFRELVGISPEQPVIGEQVMQNCVHPDDRPWVDPILKTTMSGQNDGRFVFEHRLSHSGQFGQPWVLSHGQVTFEDISGKIRPIKIFGTLQDIASRKQSEKALLGSEKKYRSIFESIDEGFSINELIIDENQKIVDVIYREANEAFERHSGIKNPVGKKASDFAPHLEEHWLNTITHVYKTGEPVVVEDYQVDLERWFSAQYSRVGDPGSVLLAVVFNDITERKEQAQKQALLLKLGDTIRLVTNPITIQSEVSHSLLEHYNAGWCYYVEWDEANNIGVVLRDASRKGLPSLTGQHDVSDVPEFLELLKANPVINVDDYENYRKLSPELRQRYTSLGFRSMLVATLVKQERIVASLLIGDSKVRKWSESEEKLLAEVAERTWIAIERANAEESLRITEERYRIALQSANMGAWDWNVIQDDVRWNDQHYVLLGLEPQDRVLDAAFFLQFIHPDDLAAVSRELMQAVEETGRYRAEAFRIIRTDGQVRWMSGYGHSVEWKDGKAARLVGVMFDITDRKKLEQQKEAFLSIASHELKTPITSLKAYAEVLQDIFDEADDPHSAALMGKMDVQVDRLTSLVDALLDTTRIAGGKLDLQKSSFPIDELILEAVEQVQLIAQEKQIKLDLYAGSIVKADRERIRQVLLNLLSNAIKYAPGTVKIVVQSEVDEKEIKVCVRDYGVGIDQVEQKNVFEQFFRASNIGNAAGLGLGLFISASIIQEHGGRITVESSKGKGSLFCFTLPIGERAL